MDNLKPITDYTVKTNSVADKEINYNWSYKFDVDKPSQSGGKQFYLKIVFNGAGPKITSITKG
jgi:hypothetical protein